MRILVIDQCSGSKDYPDESPVFDAGDIDDGSRASLLDRDGVASVKARKLYSGRQQTYITEAVDALRASGHDVDRHFISAGFGLVGESTHLPPYEVTFNEMSPDEIEERSAHLEITTAVQDLLATDPAFDIVFFALGSEYYRALDLDSVLESFPAESIGVLFNQAEFANSISNIVSIPARTNEAKEHGTIVVALKGVYLKHFADHITAGESVTTADDVVEYCTTERTPQSDFDHYV